MSTASFKTFVLGLAVGAIGGYGLGHWLPLSGVDGQVKQQPGTEMSPVDQTAKTPSAPPLAPGQSLPAAH
ncbi:MAG: hypothetical protein ACUVR8_13095 [Acidobacteriota bacterium]